MITLLIYGVVFLIMAVGVVYFFFQRQKEKKEENKKDYSNF